MSDTDFNLAQAGPGKYRLTLNRSVKIWVPLLFSSFLWNLLSGCSCLASKFLKQSETCPFEALLLLFL